MSKRMRIAAFASGGGSNIQALIDHASDSDCRWSVALVICNRDAGALERAEAAGIPGVVIPTKNRDSTEVAVETLEVLAHHRIDVICLAGYLRLLPRRVIDRFENRILNIHPALLPDFGGKGMYGMNVHRAVVDAGVSESGASVHFVTPEYDEGAVLGQARVPVNPGDTPEDVAARVLKVEHRLYPVAVDHLCDAIEGGESPTRMPDLTIESTHANS